MNEYNFLKQLKTRIKETNNSQKIYNLLETMYGFSDVKNYHILKDNKGDDYYYFSANALNLHTAYFVSIVKGSFNDEMYKGLSILVNELQLSEQVYPIEYATLFRLDGTIECYKFDYNKSNMAVPNNVKKLLKK